MTGEVQWAPGAGPGGGLDRFYETPTGAMTAGLLRERLRTMWPHARREAILGLGYVSPYLRLWREEARCCVAMVPAHLPAWRWPRKAPSASVVGEEDALPFADLTFDRVLLVHGLEHAENARRLLREAWRVLRDDGRLLVVAPNRLGLWAHLDRTPFGHGQPYTSGQLASLVRRGLFRLERRSAALYAPPVGNPLLLRLAPGWERLGQRLLPAGLAGVTLIEARKEMFGAVPAGAVRARARVLLPVAVRAAARGVPMPARNDP